MEEPRAHVGPLERVERVPTDPSPKLSEKGRGEALSGGQALKKHGETKYDVAYTSVLKRANDTLDIILKEIGQEGLQIIKSEKLNERDYGELTGLNKDDGEFWLCSSSLALR